MPPPPPPLPLPRTHARARARTHTHTHTHLRTHTTPLPAHAFGQAVEQRWWQPTGSRQSSGPAACVADHSAGRGCLACIASCGPTGSDLAGGLPQGRVEAAAAHPPTHPTPPTIPRVIPNLRCNQWSRRTAADCSVGMVSACRETEGGLAFRLPARARPGLPSPRKKGGRRRSPPLEVFMMLQTRPACRLAPHCPDCTCLYFTVADIFQLLCTLNRYTGSSMCKLRSSTLTPLCELLYWPD